MGSDIPPKEMNMQCVICKHGQTRSAHVTVTLERNGTTLVFKGVPAAVCATCAEQYIDEPTTQRLLLEAERAAQAGVEVEIRSFATA